MLMGDDVCGKMSVHYVLANGVTVFVK